MRTLAIVMTLLLLTGCSGKVGVHYESDPAAPPVHGPEPEVAHHRDLHIPPGHFPPPGQCRIWVPGTPPGKQSPPGDCVTLARQVPPGAWLLSHPRDDAGYLEVRVYHKSKPGVVVEVHLYTADTGQFVAMRLTD